MADSEPQDMTLLEWAKFAVTYKVQLTDEQLERLAKTPPEKFLEYNDKDFLELASVVTEDADPKTKLELREKLLYALKKFRTDKPLALKDDVSRPLNIVLIGETNKGKTTFCNYATNSNSPTSVTGRCTEHNILKFGLHCSTKGGKSRKWNYTLVDTPGLGDGDKKDETTLEDLNRELTSLQNIDGVFLVMNSQDPALKTGTLDMIRKFRNLFGDAFKSNWGVIFSKWFMDDLSIERREDSNVSKEGLQKSTLDVLSKAGFDYLPTEFFYIDSKPKRRPEVKATEDELTRICEWVEGRTPIHTMSFHNQRDCEKKHGEYARQLVHLWNEKYQAKAVGDDIELEKVERRHFRTAVSFTFQLGIPGVFYNATHILLTGIRESKVRDNWAGRTHTLATFLDGIKEFSDYYIDNATVEVIPDEIQRPGIVKYRYHRTCHTFELRCFPKPSADNLRERPVLN